MNRQSLAKKLISAKSERERKTLLRENETRADARLAVALKEICYAAWTIDPVKARKTARAAESLAEFNENEEIQAYSFWISGIADLTRGQLESTIERLDRAAARFKKIEMEREAANTQVAKLYALALLGKYDEAARCGEAALEIFERCGDELAAGKIENNIGNIFIRRGAPQNAEKYFLSARRRFRKIRNTEQLVLSEIGLANAYSDLNDFRKADRFYRKTLSTAQKLKMTLREAEIETNIGILALYRGKYDEALKYLEMARQTYEKLEMPHQIAISELEIAGIYQALNLSDEAFEIYEKTCGELRRLKLQGEEARARADFGKTALEKNNFQKAKNELKKSARLYNLEKNPAGEADVKLIESHLERSLGKYEAALKLNAKARRLLAGTGNLRLRLKADFMRGEILQNLGQFEKAERLLIETYESAAEIEQLNLAQMCLNALGASALSRGEKKLAENYFQKAVKMVEKLRAPLPAEEFRMSFLADKLLPFENLAKIYLGENKIAKAFLFIEKAKSRTLFENLSGETGGLKTSGKASAKDTGELNALREELNWFYNRLSRAADEAEIPDLQNEIQTREKQISVRMRRIESTQTPDGAKTGRKINDFSVKELRLQLGAGKALIEFVKFGDVFSAFVITDKTIRFFVEIAEEAEIISLLEGLHFQFGAMRYGAGVLGKFASELKTRADFYLRRLYEKLLEPLEKFIKQKHLIIVPVSTLFYVPFHALYDGEKYAVEKREIVYSPSAAIWTTLDEKPEDTFRNALLIGFADERIPLVDQEIKQLEKIFPRSKTLTAEKAKFSAYKKHAENFDVLHLACHGQFRPDNPLFSSLHLADGFITARDICAQKLNAGLVTLSACETGLNKIYAGDEILGLARGFLSAGANRVVLSLWTVDDEATTALMRKFYNELQRGRGVGASLRIAQKEFIKENKHPYFWSPFAIIGK